MAQPPNHPLLGIVTLVIAGSAHWAAESRHHRQARLTDSSAVIPKMVAKSLITPEKGKAINTWASEAKTVTSHHSLRDMYGEIFDLTEQIKRQNIHDLTFGWNHFLKTAQETSPPLMISQTKRLHRKTFPLSIALCTATSLDWAEELDNPTLVEVTAKPDRRRVHNWMHTVAKALEPKVFHRASTRNLLLDVKTGLITARVWNVPVGALAYNEIELASHKKAIVVWSSLKTPEATSKRIKEKLLDHLLQRTGHADLVICRLDESDPEYPTIKEKFSKSLETESAIFGRSPVWVKHQESSVSDSDVHEALSTFSDKLVSLAEQNSLLIRMGNRIESKIRFTPAPSQQ